MTKAKERWFCVSPECTFYTSKLELSIEHQGIDKDIAQTKCEHEPLCHSYRQHLEKLFGYQITSEMQ